MAALLCKGFEIYEILGEMAGYKAGLALSLDELVRHLDGAELPPQDDSLVRIRYEDLEEMVRRMLYRLGVLENETSHGLPTLDLLAAHHADPKSHAIVMAIIDELVACGKRAAVGQPFDLRPIGERVLQDFGDAARPVLREFDSRLTDHLSGSIFSSFRRIEWKNSEELSDLFRSERVDPIHGTFIDQRYIDYLDHNFDSIDNINWRKFEGLTAEFFDRAGFRVELGKGRGDGGVDIRVWSSDANADDKPLILIQCKREKGKVQAGIVKALWADMQHAGAASGLIVTTRALAPGAAQTAIARSYPITAIERPDLQKFLKTLRTPGTGLFILEN